MRSVSSARAVHGVLPTAHCRLSNESPQRGLSHRLELVARPPSGHVRRFRDHQANFERKLRVFDHPLEVPAGVDVIGGLVIVLCDPRIDLRASPAWRPAGVLERRKAKRRASLRAACPDWSE